MQPVVGFLRKWTPEEWRELRGNFYARAGVAIGMFLEGGILAVVLRVILGEGYDLLCGILGTAIAAGIALRPPTARRDDPSNGQAWPP